MNCNHFCNEPLRCPTCIRRFWKWAEARTNSPPPRRRYITGHRHSGPSFYASVNTIAPIVTLVQVEAETR